LSDDCGFERKTSLYLARRKSEVSKLRKEYDTRKAFGFHVEYLEAKDIESRTSFSAPEAILFYGDAQIDLEVLYTWAGTFGETKNDLAYIGQTPEFPHAYFAIGYGGNGITFSVIAAKIITDLHLGRPNPDADIFRFER
jgi:hypothetical protein